MSSSESSQKKQIVSSSWRRRWELLGAAAQLAQSEARRAAVGLIRSGGGQELLETRIKQATQLVQQLASLKGAAMKFGQVLALEARDFFPDEVVQVLERLQSSAEPMSGAVIEKVLRSELGARFRDLENLDLVPIAAASIGQVHRARLRGKDVAVKVQYPGVDQALDSDLNLLQKVISVVAVVSGKREVDYRGLIEEIASVFEQEIDYQSEAQFLIEYREKARELSGIWIPDVYPEYSSRRVLTMEFAHGLSLAEAIRSEVLNSELKDFYSDMFMRLYAYEFCHWGMVQTDPNLGNFLLDPKTPQLTLLDFGATKKYDEDFRKLYCRLIIAAHALDRKNTLRLAYELSLLDPREGDEAQAALVDLILESMSPFRKKVHDFADETYPKQMRELTRRLITELEFSPPPRELIFLHRKLGGIFQILRRLDAKRSLAPYFEIYSQMGERT